MISYFDLGVKEAVKLAFKKKEKEARLGRFGKKKPTYETISPSSNVGKANVQTKGVSR